jgi:30S ribosomal protein S31
MGRGDKRSRKGKIFKGSYGNSRPHKVEKPEVSVVEKTKSEPVEKPAKKAVKKAPAKKVAKKKEE